MIFVNPNRTNVLSTIGEGQLTRPGKIEEIENQRRKA
jgi:hypothetical protein